MGTVSREQDSEDSAKQSVWAVESGKCGAAAVRVEGSKTAVTSDEERCFGRFSRASGMQVWFLRKDDR